MNNQAAILSGNTDSRAIFQEMAEAAIVLLLDTNLPHTAVALREMLARLESCDAVSEPNAATFVFIQDAALALIKLAGRLSLDPIAATSDELRAFLLGAQA